MFVLLLGLDGITSAGKEAGGVLKFFQGLFGDKTKKFMGTIAYPLLEIPSAPFFTLTAVDVGAAAIFGAKMLFKRQQKEGEESPSTWFWKVFCRVFFDLFFQSLVST